MTAGTLDDHVFEEVSGSVGGTRFHPGVGTYPDIDGGGLSMRM